LLDVILDPPAEIPRHRVGPALLRLGPGRGERSVLFVQRELVDVLVLDVLQVLLAEVAHADALGEIVADEPTGRLGGEDLPAVAGRADACRPDDVQADVSLLADGRLARVQAHPYSHLRPVGPRVLRQGTLAVDRGEHGLTRARERVEERVTLC